MEEKDKFGQIRADVDYEANIKLRNRVLNTSRRRANQGKRPHGSRFLHLPVTQLPSRSSLFVGSYLSFPTHMLLLTIPPPL